MKTSSETARRRTLSVQTAWGCLTTNLAMPGFGSIVAGRKIAGLLQALISLVGMALTFIYGARFIMWYIANWTELTSAEDPVASISQMWIQVRWALLGIGTFLFAALWALMTSLAVLREVKSAQKPPPAL